VLWNAVKRYPAEREFKEKFNKKIKWKRKGKLRSRLGIVKSPWLHDSNIITSIDHYDVHHA
jgi:hypothetical protein